MRTCVILTCNNLGGNKIVHSNAIKMRGRQKVAEGDIKLGISEVIFYKHLEFDANIRGVIPTEIGNLKQLEGLILSTGSLTGSIPSSIVNISSLRSIDFTSNNLSGSLPLNIQYDLPILEELFLMTNRLSGQIPSKLGECRGL
ncbi:DNA damage-repair/toleration protein DRT100-like [Cornus florida]|uniref:DNA damage-repair/toleration protein DRT100-like n=1 Tax=Cornus florida TaxID=4283 RepID=UPI002896F398|nr:DNA damage-repair/toleration protein DRT100-like [Cornus florida]